MTGFIQRRLEVRISIALLVVVGLVIGAFTLVDIRNMRLDTIRAAESSMAGVARVVKGNVNAAMQKGDHSDVQRIMDEARSSFALDRIVLYDERGMKLRVAGPDETAPGARIRPDILAAVGKGDVTDVRDGDSPALSAYSPVSNQPSCFRCHGNGRALNGILRIDLPLGGVQTLITSRRNRILVWAVFMIAVLTASVVLLLRRLVHRPVDQLRHAMALAEEGRRDLQLPITGSDELSELKQRFLTMLDHIAVLHAANVEKEKELVHNREELRFRAELQAMFDAMPDGVLLIDRTLRIIQSNPRISALLPQLPGAGGVITPERVRADCCPFQGLEEALVKAAPCESQCTIALPGREARNLHSIAVPIVQDGRAEFAVVVVRDMTERVRTERALEERTAELTAANERLAQLAVTDGLTQVHNRRSFDEVLAKEVKRFNRRKYAHLSVMMIDIDHFKALNDRLGHLTGDKVLREVATMLKENVRETDTVARFGGEEFVIVMPDTHLEGAAFRAEQLRKKVQDRVLSLPEGTEVRTTVSIGVAVYASGTSLDLLKLADQALYQAKRAGRNNVVVNRPVGVVQD